MRYKEFIIEGRNAVLEAFRAGKTIDKLFVLDGCQDGPVKSILREAKKTDTIINFVDKERLDRLANSGHHQGVVAQAAAYEYAEVEDILNAAKERVKPLLFLFWTRLKTHTIWGQLSVLQTFAGHTVLLFRSAVPWDLRRP